MAWFGGSSPNNALASDHLKAFLQGLQDYGHSDGKDIDIVYRRANNDTSRQPALAKELVALNPDVIVTANNEASVAVRGETTTVPIVDVLTVEPLQLGLAKSYNHPGYNLTGLLLTVDTLPAKRLELLLQLILNAKTVGVLINPTSQPQQDMLGSIEQLASNRQMSIIVGHVQAPTDLDAAFEKFNDGHADCVVFGSDLLFFTEVSRILRFQQETHTPVAYGFRQHVERGGLMSYGVVTRENFRRAAYFVDRILKGARPGDLPIELPVKLELIINLKTAKEFGLEVPSKLLFTADAVIE